MTDQYRLKLYVQVRDLTGQRMTDGEIRLVCRIGRETQTLTTHGRCVGYDPDSHTALFEVSEFWEEASGLEEELTLEVISMWPRYYSFGGEPLPLEEVTGRTLDCMTLENGQVVVAPGQTPAPLEDFEWAELSSMGLCGRRHLPGAVPSGGGGGPGGVGHPGRHSCGRRAPVQTSG